MRLHETLAIERDAVAATYDELYEQSGELRESDGFYHWVLDQLAPRRGASLLDVACGEGHLVRLARQRGLLAVGVDFSRLAAIAAGRNADLGVAGVADGERLPFAAGSLSYVTNMGSLEHFIHPLEGVREMRRVLQPGGQAAILLPNSYYLIDILWHVWRTGYSVSHRQVVERFATRHEWRDLLEEGGLKVRRTYKYNYRFPRSRDDWHWYRQHPRKLLYLLTAPFIPFNLSYSFLFICDRA